MSPYSQKIICIRIIQFKKDILSILESNKIFHDKLFIVEWPHSRAFTLRLILLLTSLSLSLHPSLHSLKVFLYRFWVLTNEVLSMKEWLALCGRDLPPHASSISSSSYLAFPFVSSAQVSTVCLHSFPAYLAPHLRPPPQEMLSMTLDSFVQSSTKSTAPPSRPSSWAPTHRSWRRPRKSWNS